MSTKHKVSKATGFHLKLREGTQKLHDEAESGNFQIRMVNGELARREFSTFLCQMRHVHAVLDSLLEEAALRDSRINQIFDESHKRLWRIEEDLNDLECFEKPSMLSSTKSFTEFITNLFDTNPVSLIGVLYVKEGATNGNKFMAKKLRETLGLGDDKVMGYLDPHGAEQRKKWNQFKIQLNELELTETEESLCVSVAQETFRMMMNVTREMSEVESV